MRHSLNQHEIHQHYKNSIIIKWLLQNLLCLTLTVRIQDDQKVFRNDIENSFATYFSDLCHNYNKKYQFFRCPKNVYSV